MHIVTRWGRWVWIIVVAILLVWGFTDVRRRADIDPHNIRAHRTDFTVYTEAGAAFFDGRDPTLSQTPEAGTISIRHFSPSSLPLSMRSPQAGKGSRGSC
jgi:hypothetical protein